MLYAITTGGIDVNSTPKQEIARQLHLQRVEQLVADGRLVLAGAFPAVDSPDPGPTGVTGNLIVAEFDSVEDVQSWIDSSPDSSDAGLFDVDVKPFLQTLP
jgi:hypothetical protein